MPKTHVVQMFYLVDDDLTIYKVTKDEYKKILQEIIDGHYRIELPTGIGQADDISVIAEDPDMAEDILNSITHED